jgi:hypothetical protein
LRGYLAPIDKLRVELEAVDKRLVDHRWIDGEVVDLGTGPLQPGARAIAKRFEIGRRERESSGPPNASGSPPELSATTVSARVVLYFPRSHSGRTQ